MPHRRPSLRVSLVILATLLVATQSACSRPGAESNGRLVRPGAPGEPSQTLPSTGVPHASLPHTAADVHFMHGMIVHHQQALEMSALIEGRTTRREILLLGQRIVISQDDEIALMRNWLTDRGETVPDGGMHHPMAGMLSEEQMRYLADVSGTEFDRLFLAGMIQHHEGALAMVAELFSNPGAAQEDEIFQFASHVESDQRVEIARMHALLRSVLAEGS